MNASGAPFSVISRHKESLLTRGYAFSISKSRTSITSPVSILLVPSSTNLRVTCSASSIDLFRLNPICASGNHGSLHTCTRCATTLASNLDPTLSNVMPRQVDLSALSPFCFHRGTTNPLFQLSRPIRRFLPWLPPISHFATFVARKN